MVVVLLLGANRIVLIYGRVIFGNLPGGRINMARNIRCPNCGFEFPKPVIASKITVGFTFTFFPGPLAGKIKCPQCGNEELTYNYLKV